MRKIFTCFTAAVVAAGFSAPAAADDMTTVTIEVEFEDLDLANEQDFNELEARVARAARSACNRRSSGSGYISLHMKAQCQSDLIAGAAAQMTARREVALAAAQHEEVAMR